MSQATKNNVYSINQNPYFIDSTKNKDVSFNEVSGTSALQYEKVKDDFMRNDYITRPEFNEHKQHLDTRFDIIDKNSEEVKEAIKDLQSDINEKLKENKKDILKSTEKTVESEISKMKDKQTRWFIATITSILGIVGKIFNIY